MGGRRRSRKMRGGNGYGFGEPITVGALTVNPNNTSVPGGAPYKPAGGRRRSRKTRRRGGDFPSGLPVAPGQEPSAPPADDEDLVTKDKCTAADRKWVMEPGAKASNGEQLGKCRGNTGFAFSKDGKHAGRRRRGRKTRRGGSSDPSGLQKFGGRRRSRRKSKKMRGGGSVAGVGYGYGGDGSRGMATFGGYPSNLPPSGTFAIPTGTR
jgi:hypothetical protein